MLSLVPPAEAQDAPVFKAESSLVVLHVTVKDKQNHYVGGLPKDAFEVFEDDKPQEVALFTAEDAPVTVGLLIDNSGSMHSNRELVLTAATAFVERSNRSDEVFGLTFNEDVRAALPRDMPFTSDAQVLRSALAGTVERARPDRALRCHRRRHRISQRRTVRAQGAGGRQRRGR